MLAGLPDNSVHTICTSPPYWQKRAYVSDDDLARPFEIGRESTPQAYIDNLMAVFQACRRVLHPSGAVWINLDSSYAGSHNGAGDRRGRKDLAKYQGRQPGKVVGFPDKTLIPLVGMFEQAMIADGWYLRAEVVWSKQNPLPDRPRDRVTHSHELLLHFTRQAHYYHDWFAVMEPTVDGQGMRPLRSVWHLKSEPNRDGNFAGFPSEIPERCIKMSSSEHGVCPACGSPWQRRLSRENDQAGRKPQGVTEAVRHQRGSKLVNHGNGMSTLGTRTVYRHWGWEPTCQCGRDDVVPAVVLDPFSGAGTTLVVAQRLGRDAIGIELAADSIAKAERRLAA